MKKGLLFDREDNVGVVKEHVEPGDEVEIGGYRIIARDVIDLPHKIALCDLEPGEQVIKYGSSIGYATQKIRSGEHVHVHNLDSEKMMK